MAKPIPTSSSHLTCLCGAISLPGSYLKEKRFPIPSTVCHCNPCRYTCGGLLPAFAFLTGAPPEEIKSRLTAYQFTPHCIRYFCSTCGCHCFVEHPQMQGEWFCAAGIIEPPTGMDNVVRLAGHKYVDDTVDGGLVPLFLPITSPFPSSPSQKSIFGGKDGVNPRSESDLNELSHTASQLPLPDHEDLLPARCHCGGVDLHIKRADYASEPAGVKALMSPDQPHKYLARFCACRSCRLALGSSLTPWMYTSLPAVTIAKTSQPVLFGADAEAQDANEGLNLKHYESSDGVWRSFCGWCGATVFYYTRYEKRSDVLDISVGILRAGSGSLAREWVRWAEGEVSCGEEGTDKDQVGCLMMGKVF